MFSIRPIVSALGLCLLCLNISAQDLVPLNLSTMKTGASIFVMESLGNNVYFDAWMPGIGRQLWRTDGTGGATEVVLMLSESLPGVDIRSVDRVGDHLIIEYLDADNKYNIVMYDGSDTIMLATAEDLRTDVNVLGDQAIIERRIEGTPTLLLVKDGQANVLKKSTAELRIAPVRQGDQIYFSLQDLALGVDSLFLLSIEGNIEFIRKGRLFSPLGVSNAGVFYEPNDSTYRINGPGTEFVGEHIYRTGQVGSQLIALKRIGGEPSTLVEVGDEIREITTIHDVGSIYPVGGGRAVLLASIFRGGNILWGYDSSTGTADSILYFPTPSSGISLRYVANFGDGLLFIINTSDKGDQLWYTDGTAEGTQMISEPDFNGYGAIVIHLGMKGNTYYFGQSHPDYGIEPWFISTDNFAPTMLADVNPGRGDGVLDIGENTVLGRRSLINGDTLYIAASLTNPTEQPQLLAVDLTTQLYKTLTSSERSGKHGADALILGKHGDYIIALATPDSLYSEQRIVLINQTETIQPTGIVPSGSCEFHPVNDEFGYFLDHPVIYRFHFDDMSVDTIYANFQNIQGRYRAAVGANHLYVAPTRNPASVYRLSHTSNDMVKLPAPPGSEDIVNFELRVLNETLFFYRINFPVQLYRYTDDLPERVFEFDPVISWTSDESFIYLSEPSNTFKLDENLEGEILFQGGDLLLEGGILVSSAQPDVNLYDTEADTIVHTPFGLEQINDPVRVNDLLFFHNDNGIQYLDLTTGELKTAFANTGVSVLTSVYGYACGYFSDEELLRCHNGDSSLSVSLAGFQPSAAFDSYNDVQNGLYFTLTNEEFGENDLFVLLLDETSSTLQEIHTEALSVFPNPSHGEFAVSAGYPIPSIARVELYDAQGKQHAIDVQYDASGMNVRLLNKIPGVYYLLTEVEGEFYLGTVVID